MLSSLNGTMPIFVLRGILALFYLKLFLTRLVFNKRLQSPSTA
ncbi:hypothetical protein PYCH_11020 [Pyrococcus yayanosii CH1]|uniref:Uncharacterized protein n=1 Tax=Pyrococcus yayanosii (strain CH1 / JCM 16557) TaxID=529709 RepID=F8AEV0_PYRYC|nr:hypothetical protein PYCH_11020 [Pyrococcus yayanosii CH1]